MIKIGVGDSRKRHGERKKRRRDSPCDGSCDTPDCCDGPACCDFGLFSTMLLGAAALAERTGSLRRGRAARAGLDRFGSAAIRGYRRWLSPHWPGRCRYTPTCSAYGLAAVDRYGLAEGGRVAAARLRRCRPEVPGGTFDPLR